VAVLIALVYRFPIPFYGYASGVKAMAPAVGAVIIYGLFGGFALLGALGALGGWFAHRRYETRCDRNKHWEIIIFAFASDFAALGLLAVLDKIIGPW
jgi:hypothetical protein